jgi:cyclin B
MTERYVRQTYKNLIGGGGGGGGGLQSNQAARDENLIKKDKDNLSQKTTNLLTNLISHSNLIGEAASQQQNDKTDIRNALGDIGNKCLANFKSNDEGKKAASAIVTKSAELIKKQPTDISTTTTTTTTTTLPQVIPESAISSSTTDNNSCSMIELDSSDEEEEEEDEIEESIEEEDGSYCEELEEEDESKYEALVNESDQDLILLEDEDEKEQVLLSLEFPADGSGIVDIDEDDSDNTQLCAEYVKDIYNYLNQVEKKYRVSPRFLDGKTVTAKMRSILIDWLIQVHLKFHLLNETLYLCVQIIDAYLEAVVVTKMQLQLVGVAAMFVACKYEEMYVPAIEDFVYMTDNTYTKTEIRQMEISILKTMNYMFSKPLPLHFLRRFSKAGKADPKQHTLAKFFMELSLHDAEFSSYDPSYLAACSLCLSFKLLDGPTWSRQLEFYTTYKTSKLMAGMQKIAKVVFKAHEANYKYKAASNKYSASKFLRISLLPELTQPFMKELATSGKF